jgi:hypothetical protein
MPYVQNMKRGNSLTPANIFNELVFAPLANAGYNQHITQDIKDKHRDNPLSKARAFREASSILFDDVITRIVLEQTYEKDPSDVTSMLNSTTGSDKRKELNNYKRRVLFRKSALHAIHQLLANSDQYQALLLERIGTILQHTIDRHLDGSQANQARAGAIRSRMTQGRQAKRARMDNEIVWLPGEKNDRSKQVETIQEDDMSATEVIDDDDNYYI